MRRWHGFNWVHRLVVRNSRHENCAVLLFTYYGEDIGIVMNGRDAGQTCGERCLGGIKMRGKKAGQT
jgi:hypothetical protein